MASSPASTDKPKPGFFLSTPQPDLDQLKDVVKVIKDPPGVKSEIPGYIYATREVQEGFVKIGWSGVDDVKRPLDLKNCGREYTHVFYTKRFPWAFKCERIIHKLLVKHRHLLFNCGCGKVKHAHHEWYKMDFLQAVSSINVIVEWMLMEPYEKIAEDSFEARLKPEWKERLTLFNDSQKTHNPQRWEEFFENPTSSPFDISPWRLTYLLDKASEIRGVKPGTLLDREKSASFSGRIPMKSAKINAPDFSRSLSAPTAIDAVDLDTYSASEDDEPDEEIASPTQLKANRKQAASTRSSRKVTRPGSNPLLPYRASGAGISRTGGQEEQQLANIGVESDSEDGDGSANPRAAAFFSAPSSPTSPTFAHKRQDEDHSLPSAAATQSNDFDIDTMTKTMRILVVDDGNNELQESGKLTKHSREDIAASVEATGSPAAATPPYRPKSRRRSPLARKTQRASVNNSSEPAERSDRLSPSPVPHPRRASLRSAKNLNLSP